MRRDISSPIAMAIRLSGLLEIDTPQHRSQISSGSTCK